MDPAQVIHELQGTWYCHGDECQYVVSGRRVRCTDTEATVTLTEAGLMAGANVSSFAKDRMSVKWSDGEAWERRSPPPTPYVAQTQQAQEFPVDSRSPAVAKGQPQGGQRSQHAPSESARRANSGMGSAVPQSQFGQSQFGQTAASGLSGLGSTIGREDGRRAPGLSAVIAGIGFRNTMNEAVKPADYTSNYNSERDSEWGDLLSEHKGRRRRPETQAKPPQDPEEDEPQGGGLPAQEGPVLDVDKSLIIEPPTVVSGDALVRDLQLQVHEGKIVFKKRFGDDITRGVTYNRASEKWEFDDDRTTVFPGETDELNVRFVSDRADRGPEGAIAVLGCVDLARMRFLDRYARKKESGGVHEGKVSAFFKARVDKKRSKWLSQVDGPEKRDGDPDEDGPPDEDVPLLEEMLEMDAFKGAGSDQEDADVEPNENSIVNTVDDGELLSIGDTAKIIRQYLTRSIVAAAHSKNGVIVTSDMTDVRYHLEKGVEGMGPCDSEFAHGKKVPLIHVGGRKPDDSYEFADYDEWFRNRPHGKAPEDLHIMHKEWCSHKVHLIREKDTCDPNERELNTAMVRLLESLWSTNMQQVAEQQDQDDASDCEGAAQDRVVWKKRTRVVGVLFGGRLQTSKFELFPFVENKWPIYIVEGSGGYADHLANTIRKVEELNAGAASKDDYQSLLSNVDTAMAKILYEGTWTLVRRGTLPEEFERMLKKSVAGEDVLTGAWYNYAAWSAFGVENQKSYRSFMLWILLLGVITTFLAIFKTFLSLVVPDQVDGKNANGSLDWAGGSDEFIPNLDAVLAVVLFVIPLAVSLIQGIANRFNAGAKWVSLKSCAEGLLSEIYMYRTECGDYSQQEIKKALEKRRAREREKAQRGVEQVPPDEEGHGFDNVPEYSTRSELLHLRLMEFTSQLSAAEMSESTIPPWTGPVPPLEVTQYGDDGYSDLTADQYTRLRLAPKIRTYNKDAEEYDKKKSKYQLIIYGVGAVGTALAAIATLQTLREYNLGAWVAFTTSIGNALMRYLDYTKAEWLHNKYTAVMHELEMMESWWGSMTGKEGARAATTERLVLGTETKITDEITEFKQQLKIAVAAAAKEADKQEEERKAITQSLQQGQKHELVKKFEGLGLQTFDADTIQAALKDPGSTEAAQLKKLLRRMDEEMGISDKIQTEVEKTKIGQVVVGAAKHIGSLSEIKGLIDEAGNLKDVAGKGALMLEQYITTDVLEAIKDKGKRALFLRHAEEFGKSHDVWQMGYGDLTNMLKKCGRQFQQQVSNQPYRLTLESLIKLCSLELHDRFESTLDQMGFTVLDFVEYREQIDMFIAEMRRLSSLPQNLPVQHVIAACSSPVMKTQLSKMTEMKVRSLLKRASKILVEDNPCLELYYSLLDTQAELDLDTVFQLAGEAAEAQVIAKVQEISDKFPLHFLDTKELLEVYPAEVRDMLKEKDHAAIVAGLNRLKRGSMAKMHMERWLTKETDMEALASGSQPLRPSSPKSRRRSYRQASGRTPQTPGAGGPARPKTPGVTGIGKKNKQSKYERYPDLEVLLHSNQVRETLVLAAERVSQVELNSLSKAALLKRIRNELGSDDKLADDLKQCSEEGLRFFLSGIRAEMANSYMGCVFDTLSSEMLAFDTAALFTWNDQHRLIGRMRDLKGVAIAKKPDSWLRSMLGHKSLVDKCSCLDPPQLKELLSRLQALVASTFSSRVFEKALERLSELSPDRIKVQDFSNWSDQTVDRFVQSCMTVPDYVLEDEPELTVGQSNDALEEWRMQIVHDPELKRVTDAMSITDVRKLVDVTKALAGEQALANTFQAASRDITSEALYHTFDAVYMLPPVRQRLVMCMTSLLTAFGDTGVTTVHLSDILEKKPEVVIGMLCQQIVIPQRELSETGDIIDPGVVVGSGVDIQKDGTSKNNKLLVNAMISVFRSQQRFVEIVRFLLCELKLMAGFRLFNRVSIAITSFNLREMMPGIQTRQCLFPFLIRIFWADRFVFPESGNSPNYAVCRIHVTDDNGLMTDVPDKDNLIMLFEEFSQPTYERVLDALTQLTKDQLVVLIGTFYKVLTTSYIGVFFQYLERSIHMGLKERAIRKTTGKRRKDEDARKKIMAQDELRKRMRNEAIMEIRNHTKIEGGRDRVRTLLDGFDARTFTGRVYSEKGERLGLLIGNDTIKEVIAGYSEKEMKSFFNYVRTLPCFQQFAEVDDIGDDIEKKERDDEKDEDGGSAGSRASSFAGGGRPSLSPRPTPAATPQDPVLAKDLHKSPPPRRRSTGGRGSRGERRNSANSASSQVSHSPPDSDAGAVGEVTAATYPFVLPLISTDPASPERAELAPPDEPPPQAGSSTDPPPPQ
eukprot:TRINITY_DN97_c0_g4_i1.p1 TRINITY_DN97_c0_g4~~TRINITY_DN97_c0_g4_i1.p1  ORF type:complete len:2335 (+),score=763.31 TRINITY_DN97_c0_g4_i1:83-7087(+)